MHCQLFNDAQFFVKNFFQFLTSTQKLFHKITDYVRKFKLANPEIPDQFYGNWSDLPSKKLLKCPTEKDSNLPTCQAEWDEMKMKLGQFGVNEEAAKLTMKQRLVIYEEALKEFNKAADCTGDYTDSPIHMQCQQESQHQMSAQIHKDVSYCSVST